MNESISRSICSVYVNVHCHLLGMISARRTGPPALDCPSPGFAKSGKSESHPWPNSIILYFDLLVDLQHMQLQSLQLGVDLAGRTPSASCGLEALPPDSPSVRARFNSSDAFAAGTTGPAVAPGTRTIMSQPRVRRSLALPRSVIDKLLLTRRPTLRWRNHRSFARRRSSLS